MISWLWLIVAFVIGALCGVITMGWCAIGKISDQEARYVLHGTKPSESSGDDMNIAGGV